MEQFPLPNRPFPTQPKNLQEYCPLYDKNQVVSSSGTGPQFLVRPTLLPKTLTSIDELPSKSNMSSVVPARFWIQMQSPGAGKTHSAFLLSTKRCVLYIDATPPSNWIIGPSATRSGRDPIIAITSDIDRMMKNGTSESRVSEQAWRLVYRGIASYILLCRLFLQCYCVTLLNHPHVFYQFCQNGGTQMLNVSEK